jgi:hypothetical protein
VAHCRRNVIERRVVSEPEVRRIGGTGGGHRSGKFRKPWTRGDGQQVGRRVGRADPTPSDCPVPLVLVDPHGHAADPSLRLKASGAPVMRRPPVLPS